MPMHWSTPVIRSEEGRPCGWKWTTWKLNPSLKNSYALCTEFNTCSRLCTIVRYILEERSKLYDKSKHASFAENVLNFFTPFLEQGEMDLIGSSLTLSLTRSAEVDYLLPIGRSYNALFIQDDQASRTSYDLLLQPLRREAWWVKGFHPRKKFQEIFF